MTEYLGIKIDLERDKLFDEPWNKTIKRKLHERR
jgi:hypothetical protein